MELPRSTVADEYDLDAVNIRALFEYDPRGWMIWIWHPSSYVRKRIQGARFGCWDEQLSHNDRYGKVFGQHYSERELVWLYHKGEKLPRHDIFYIDGNRRNNRIENLRERRPDDPHLRKVVY